MQGAQVAIDGWNAYVAWIQPYETAFLAYLDPSGQYKQSPFESYPLTSLASALVCAVAYLLMVIFGTLFMKSRKSKFNVRGLQFLYNPMQIAICSYMSIEALLLTYRHNYPWGCVPYDAVNPVMGNVLYIFYVSKLFDFLDTFFIIASKKWNQLSFLHVYHHLSTFLLYWMNSRVAYDGDMYMTIMLNGAIHVIMYMYYFVSYHTRDIWWKKYLTTLQMIQFVCMNVHAFYIIFSDCKHDFPRRVIIIYALYIQTLFWCFAKFFVSTYIKPKRAKQE